MGFYCFNCAAKVRGQPIKHKCTRQKYGSRANDVVYAAKRAVKAGKMSDAYRAGYAAGRKAAAEKKAGAADRRGSGGANRATPGAPAAPPRAAVTVFVGGLAWATTDAQLVEHFAGLRATSARVATDALTGRPAGHGFVAFACVADAEAAIRRMDGVTVGPFGARRVISVRMDCGAGAAGAGSGAGYA